MLPHRLILVPLLALFTVSPSYGGIFKRQPKPVPAVQVPALIKSLKSDPDDHKRADAAEELRDYDAKAFPDILPALIEALQNDSSSSVRHEAVISIGKMRPISQQGGYALEQAAQNDTAFRVRAAAEKNLTVWVVIYGYRRGKAPDNKNVQTGEPPLAEPLPPRINSGNRSSPPPPVVTPEVKPQEPAPIAPVPTPLTPQPASKSAEPPLMPTPGISKPLFSRPLLPLTPTKNSKPPRPADEGPNLNAPM